MTSLTNPRNISEAKKRAQKDTDGEALVIRQLMSSTEGRRWVWLALERGHIFVNQPSLDLASMAYEKGERNEALRLLKSVQRYAPDMYIRMTNEQTSSTLQESESSDD